MPRLGGGFGDKYTRNTIISNAAALAAFKLKKPVKLWLPFENNMRILGKRCPLYGTYEVAVNNEGVIQYMDTNLYSDAGATDNEPIDYLLGSAFENGYDASPWNYTLYMVTTDTPPNSFGRAPGIDIIY